MAGHTGKILRMNLSTQCGKAHLVPDSPYAGVYSEGPGYETLWVFPSPIDSISIEASDNA